MPIIGNSPWQEAAAAGSGIGNALSNAILQLPMMRAQLATQRAQLAIQEQTARDQSLADQARASLYGAQERAANSQEARAQQANVLAGQLGQSLQSAFTSGLPVGPPTVEQQPEWQWTTAFGDVLSKLPLLTGDNPQRAADAATGFGALLGIGPDQEFTPTGGTVPHPISGEAVPYFRTSKGSVSFVERGDAPPEKALMEFERTQMERELNDLMIRRRNAERNMGMFGEGSKIREAEETRIKDLDRMIAEQQNTIQELIRGGAADEGQPRKLIFNPQTGKAEWSNAPTN